MGKAQDKQHSNARRLFSTSLGSNTTEQCVKTVLGLMCVGIFVDNNSSMCFTRWCVLRGALLLLSFVCIWGWYAFSKEQALLAIIASFDVILCAFGYGALSSDVL